MNVAARTFESNLETFRPQRQHARKSAINVFTQLFLSFLPTHLDSSLDHLRNALDRISSWMTANLLTLNSSKTEFLLIGLSKQLAKIKNSSLTTPCYQRRTFRGLSVFVCWASPMRRTERLNRSRRVHVGPKESHNIRWTAH